MFRCATLALLLFVGSATAKGPNVIFILVDDMGHADLGCTGLKDGKTPNIDRIAKEGVRFTQFYSNAPVCTPTRAGFLTGRWQQRVGLEWALGFTAQNYRRVGDKLVPEEDKLALGLSPTHWTIARLLQRGQYRSGIFGKWHLGYRPEFNPMKHGFNEFFGVLLGHASFYDYKYFDGTPCLFEGEKPAKATGYLTDLLNARAVDFIQRHADGADPFFLYLPHLAVHFPYHVPDDATQTLTKENHENGTRKEYLAMLARVDRGVGEILKTLEDKKIAKDTLVIFSSDNGGYKLSDNSPFFHHKSTLWEGGVRVPCLMRWPGVLPEGKLIEQPAITMDITATILAAAKVTPPQDAPALDGIDLVPFATGKAKTIERTFCWRIDRPDRKQKAVRQGDWKYLKDGAFEFLFDLREDPGERRNLGVQNPEIVSRLRDALAAWEAQFERNPPAILVK